MDLALTSGGPDSALRYVERYLALGPTDKYAGGMRLMRVLLAPGSVSPADLARWLDTASADVLSGAYLATGYSRSAETALRLARLLAQGRPGEKPWSEPVMGQRQLARQLIRRGHLREARVVIGDATDRPMRFQYAQAVLLGGVPPDSAASTFRRWLRDGQGPAWLPLWWWAERRDTASLRQFLLTADSQVKGPSRLFLPYYMQAAPAYLALAQRDTARSLEQFMALPDSLCMVCAFERLTRVRLLSAKGRDEEARLRLEAPISNALEAIDVVWALERGRVNERLGKRAQAIEAYSFVTRAWMNADPELQPAVTEARAALARLTEEPKR